MLVSENWLRQLTNPDLDREGLSHKLTMAGLEVDDLAVLPRLDDKIVVARIVSVKPHPVKEKLQVCFVTYGNEKEIQVVCGAPNARQGLLTAFAPAGATLPNGTEIGEAELAGTTSFGMLCSEKELGISEEHSGIMELDARLQPGITVNEAVDLPDAVFDIDLTPNRGDCLSTLGVARDLSALTGSALNYTPPVAPATDQNLPIGSPDVDVLVPASCPRYCGQIIRGVDVKAPIPEWMKQRLNRGGMRSVGNAVVDVTNYVQLELGQPMHSFDLAQIHGRISVKQADAVESFTGIDGKQYSVEPGALLIADEAGILAVAGVIGAEDSAVTDSTRDILLESAFFTPDAVAGRARKMGLHTESSHRFERGVDPEGQVRALARAAELILDICGGEAGPVEEKADEQHLPVSPQIRVARDQIAKVLGSKLGDDVILDIFQRLQFEVTPEDGGWMISPPSWRQDIRLECDVIEEVIRIHGYENIPTHTAYGPMTISVAPEARLPDQRMRDCLCDAGYFEAITYSFVDKDEQEMINPGIEAVPVANPIASDMSVMRTGLWTGLLGALVRNIKRQFDTVKLFEFGNVFSMADGDYAQSECIAGIATGRNASRSWDGSDRDLDFYDVKGVVETLLALGKHEDVSFQVLQHPALHPGQAAEILVNGEVAGKMGRLHPTIAKAKGLARPVYLFELNAERVRERTVTEFSPLSQFPPVKRDLAIVVDASVSFEDVRKCVLQTSSKLLSKLELFDVYAGNNVDLHRKSLGFSLTFQASSRTLNDTEVGDQMNLVISALQDSFSAEIRK